MPLHSLLFPVLEPLHVRARLDEELHLHLLELTCAENEISGRDLVAERFADLRDSKRDLLSCRLLDVEEIDVNPLRGLRPQVDDGCRIRSEEHTSELQSRRDLVCRL